MLSPFLGVRTRRLTGSRIKARGHDYSADGKYKINTRVPVMKYGKVVQAQGQDVWLKPNADVVVTKVLLSQGMGCRSFDGPCAGQEDVDVHSPVISVQAVVSEISPVIARVAESRLGGRQARLDRFGDH